MSRPKSAQNPIDLHIGQRLRRRRLELNLEVREVELAIDTNVGAVSRFEDGTRPISSGQRFRLGRLLDVSLAYPFDGLPDRPAAVSAEALNIPEAGLEKEIARFMKAYAAIDDQDLRKRLFNLVKSVAEGDMNW